MPAIRQMPLRAMLLRAAAMLMLPDSALRYARHATLRC